MKTLRKIFLTAFFVPVFCFGQKPHGRFLHDTLVIGKEIKFTLSIRHNSHTPIVFPDSTYNYKPFELIGIEFLPTYTIGSVSVDSAVYSLVSFSTDSILYLSLPVTYLQSGKKVFSDTSKTSLHSTLKSHSLKQIKPETSTGFFEVPTDFNYPKIFYFLGLLLAISTIFWLVFGKLILRNYKIWLYKNKHRGFLSIFKRLSRNIESEKIVSETLLIWKKHMAWLLQKPIESMSTKEISETIKNERLIEALKEFDLAIYGGKISPHISVAIIILQDAASEAFRSSFKSYKAKLKAS